MQNTDRWELEKSLLNTGSIFWQIGINGMGYQRVNIISTTHLSFSTSSNNNNNNNNNKTMMIATVISEHKLCL